MAGAASAASSAVDAVGGVVQGAVDTVGDAGQGVIDMAKDVASTDLGKAALIGGALYATGGLGAAGEAAAADEAGAAALGDTAAVVTPVTAGSVTETPLGTLDAATAGGGATDAAAGAGAADAVSNSTSAAGGAAATDAVSKAGGADTIGDKLSGNLGSSAISDIALTAGGTATLLKAVQQPEIVQQPTATTTSTSLDGTAGERRATADEISNVMAFQTQASQRARLSGAALLSKSTTATANVGTKKLLGA